MIRGTVLEGPDNELEPWLCVSVEYANEGLMQCEVILDTGFTGWLTLPEQVIRELGLRKIGSHFATLASGEMEQFDYYVTRMVWHGRLQWIEILQSINQSLLGMELLRDNWITMFVQDGGDVIIQEN